MCDPGTLALIAIGTQVAGTVVSTVGSVKQANFERKVANENQKLENERIVDAMQRGEVEARDAARRQAQLRGAQRAAMAANGVDLSFGSAADLLADSAMASAEEQSNIRKNTDREIRSGDINAANFGNTAKAAGMRKNNALVGGAIQGIGTIAAGASRMGRINYEQSQGRSGWG